MELARGIERRLRAYDSKKHPLVGIKLEPNCHALVEQIVESIRRIRYVAAIREATLSESRADPSTKLFDPLMAAVLRQREGQIDDAFWLVFLSVHFGKNRTVGWQLCRDVYGRLGRRPHWSWERVSANPSALRDWLATHEAALKPGGVVRFGNHRKYESLRADSARGTGAVIHSYVNWIGRSRSHEAVVSAVEREVGNDPKAVFDHLYHSMGNVLSFGRMARFDYLTMVGKLQLAAIEPGIPYLAGATGPLKGAHLLFEGIRKGSLDRHELESRLVELGASLDVGMQVIEDALCNWQKSPTKFVPFRG